LQLNNQKQDLSEEEVMKQCKLIKGKVLHKLKSNLYAWKPIEYNHINSLIYMVARCAPEYYVLTTIFNEIKIRDSDFKPQTIFDFGSGVGSVLW
jgi:ribosomal protein RSM22 (predicted rRNA methylase)